MYLKTQQIIFLIALILKMFKKILVIDFFTKKIKSVFVETL